METMITGTVTILKEILFLFAGGLNTQDNK